MKLNVFYILKNNFNKLCRNLNTSLDNTEEELF